MNIEELNDMKKRDCVVAIRQDLAATTGDQDPGSVPVYEVFCKTKHSSGDEQADKKYLAQTISHIRKDVREGHVEAPKIVRVGGMSNITIAQLGMVEKVVPSKMELWTFLRLSKEFDSLATNLGGFDALATLMQSLRPVVKELGGPQNLTTAIEYLARHHPPTSKSK